MDYKRFVINLLKSYISGNNIDAELDRIQKKLVIELDRCKVNNEPCEEINALYEDVMWLKCEVLPNKVI